MNNSLLIFFLFLCFCLLILLIAVPFLLKNKHKHKTKYFVIPINDLSIQKSKEHMFSSTLKSEPTNIYLPSYQLTWNYNPSSLVAQNSKNTIGYNVESNLNFAIQAFANYYNGNNQLTQSKSVGIPILLKNNQDFTCTPPLLNDNIDSNVSCNANHVQFNFNGEPFDDDFYKSSPDIKLIYEFRLFATNANKISDIQSNGPLIYSAGSIPSNVLFSNPLQNQTKLSFLNLLSILTSSSSSSTSTVSFTFYHQIPKSLFHPNGIQNISSLCYSLIASETKQLSNQNSSFCYYGSIFETNLGFSSQTNYLTVNSLSKNDLLNSPNQYVQKSYQCSKENPDTIDYLQIHFPEEKTTSDYDFFEIQNYETAAETTDITTLIQKTMPKKTTLFRITKQDSIIYVIHLVSNNRNTFQNALFIHLKSSLLVPKKITKEDSTITGICNFQNMNVKNLEYSFQDLNSFISIPNQILLLCTSTWISSNLKTNLSISFEKSPSFKVEDFYLIKNIITLKDLQTNDDSFIDRFINTLVFTKLPKQITLTKSIQKQININKEIKAVLSQSSQGIIPFEIAFDPIWNYSDITNGLISIKLTLNHLLFGLNQNIKHVNYLFSGTILLEIKCTTFTNNITNEPTTEKSYFYKLLNELKFNNESLQFICNLLLSPGLYQFSFYLWSLTNNYDKYVLIYQLNNLQSFFMVYYNSASQIQISDSLSTIPNSCLYINQ